MNIKILALAVIIAASSIGIGLYRKVDPAPSIETTPSLLGESSHPNAQSREAGEMRDQTAQPSPTRNEQIELPVEQGLIVNGAISLGSIKAALRDPKFNNYILTLRQQGLTNPEAQETTATYRAALENRFKKSPKVALTDVACGTVFCAGTVNLQTGSDPNWVGLLFGENAMPSYGFVSNTLNLSGGNYEGRFVFSVDPGMNKMRLPRTGTKVQITPIRE